MSTSWTGMRSLESRLSERCVRLLRNSLASDRVDKFVGRDRPESCTRDDRCSRLAGRDSPTQIDQLNELKSRTHRGLQDLTWLTRSWCCWVGLRWPGPIKTAFKRKPSGGSYFWPSRRVSIVLTSLLMTSAPLISLVNCAWC